MMTTKLQTLREEREDGFTLIELLVVILIIGILSAIAIPAFLNQRKSAVDASVQSDVKNAATLVEDWTLANYTHELTEFRVDSARGAVASGSVDTPFAFVSPMGLFQNLPTVTDSSDLESQIKVSDGNMLFVKAGVSGDGFCIYGVNPGGDLAATKGITFDSLAGGMNRSGVACATTMPKDVVSAIGGGGGGDVALPETQSQDVTTKSGKKVKVTWTEDKYSLGSGSDMADWNTFNFTTTPAVDGQFVVFAKYGDFESEKTRLSTFIDNGQSRTQYSGSNSRDSILLDMEIDDTVGNGSTANAGKTMTLVNETQDNEYGAKGVKTVLNVTYDKDAPTKKMTLSGTTVGQIKNGYIKLELKGLYRFTVLKVTNGSFSGEYYSGGNMYEPEANLANLNNFIGTTYDESGQTVGYGF